MHDSAVTPVQQQLRFRPAARPWVAFGSVVEYLELSKVRKEADKIPPAATFLVSESEYSLTAKFLVPPGRFHLLFEPSQSLPVPRR
jgi:hypothetical protein